MKVDIYAKGALCLSVCAPKDMPREEVERQVNAEHPCGTDLGWSISTDEYFSDGTTPNGGIVQCHNGETRHWLLDA